MGEGKTGLVLIGAVVAALALAAAGAVYVRSRPPAAAPVPSPLQEELPSPTPAPTPGQDRVSDVLTADDYLDEALNDLDAVNF